jgi:chorismate synthase
VAVFRFLTAGESHGRALVAIVDGTPAGLKLSASDLARDLRRRQLGYGRGRRMAIEQDAADILSGVRRGETLGSPIALLIQNRDFTNWQYTMSVEADPPADAGGAHRPDVTRPRPGHADLSAGLKYGRTDLRDVLERASARETAARVAVGAIAKMILREIGIQIASHVTTIGDASLSSTEAAPFSTIAALGDEDDVRCVEAGCAERMKRAIDRAREAGDTVGGAFEIVAHNVPPGLGSHVQWDRKLDGRIAQAMMSIPAIKAVGLGLAADVGHLPGSQVHDEIRLRESIPGIHSRNRPRDESDEGTVPGISRPTNRAGGVEGGVTNGQDVRVTAWMKPISTLMKPLRSVDLASMTESPAAIERSDVCAVPAAAVVGEAMLAITLAEAVLEKFGGDTVAELRAAWQHYTASLATRLGGGKP